MKKKSSVVSAHFQSVEDVERIHEAAAIEGVSPSALIREAVVAASAKILARKTGKCPTCGSKRAA